MDTGRQCSLSVWTQADRSASTVRLKVTIKVSSPIAVRSTNIVGLKVAVKVSYPTAGNPPEGKSSISHGRQISLHYSVKGDS